MARRFSTLILKWLGWKFEGRYPHKVDKMIIIVIPHTSNWDFPLGLLYRDHLKAKIKFIAKKSLFKFPYGFLFKVMGGIPVDRSKSQNFVQAVVEMIGTRKKVHICIAPEGTRGKVHKLKSGFYYIAKGANIPIVMVKFDYGKKVLGIAEPLLPPDTYEEMIPILKNYFQDVRGKKPEQGWY